ncbi:hypothetical protein [Actinopolymorpha singaporensis]|uniref:Oligosaccharide repeat unit polymerase n=1 Tax=Actinopolymorpha singaporensis TaxID=117157 RepID=A0A1H1MP06_9ACTN|nr:hypothetical protein [Actinopolymorpha singaporensis]SDR88457.1 hypothetical protein SAMN04489717_0902 [Actinopolymorpha singaporensis]
MSFSLSTALLVDSAVVAACGAAFFRNRHRRHSHPAFIYLIFHVMLFTFRGWAIRQGSPTFLGLSEAEVVRALLAADVFLLSAAFGWLMPTPAKWTETPTSPRELRPAVVTGVAVFLMPIGLYFLATRTYTSGSGTENVALSTSYEIFAVTWPGLLLLGLVYVKGFRWYLLCPLAMYLCFMGLQSQDRFRVILPLILLGQIWLDRKGRRWPTTLIVAGMVAVFPVFVAMDAIGAAYRTGSLTPQVVSQEVSRGIGESFSGGSNDQLGLDALGVAMAQSDRYGVPLYGKDYVNVLFLPIPRPLWPDKPVLNEAVVKLSTSDRPLSAQGAVLTMPGSLYVDFRWVGLTLVAFLLARAGLWVYCRAYAHGMGTAFHFAYLLVAASLIQIYRDSLTSLVTFLLVNSAPLVVILVVNMLHKPPHRILVAEAQIKG